MAGRKRKPDQLKVVQGTFRPDRANPDAPEPVKEQPEPPGWLSPDAHGWFDVLCDRLESIGCKSASFTEIVSIAASRIIEVEDADESIAIYGRVYTTTSTSGDTVLKANPAVGNRDAAIKHLHSLLSELGLTPASISKVKVPGKDGKESNPFEGMR